MKRSLVVLKFPQNGYRVLMIIHKYKGHGLIKEPSYQSRRHKRVFTCRYILNCQQTLNDFTSITWKKMYLKLLP